MNNGNYAAKAPYPNTVGISEDRRSTKPLFVMRDGELETISEYIYQGIIFGEIYPQLSTLLEGIAITEMTHYRLLSEAIARSGGNPTVNTRVKTSFIDISADTPSIAPYVAKRTVKSDIDAENASAAEYRALAATVRDETLSALLLRLSEDEELHAELLTDALDSIRLG